MQSARCADNVFRPSRIDRLLLHGIHGINQEHIQSVITPAVVQTNHTDRSSWVSSARDLHTVLGALPLTAEPAIENVKNVMSNRRDERFQKPELDKLARYDKTLLEKQRIWLRDHFKAQKPGAESFLRKFRPTDLFDVDPSTTFYCTPRQVFSKQFHEQDKDKRAEDLSHSMNRWKQLRCAQIDREKLRAERNDQEMIREMAKLSARRVRILGHQNPVNILTHTYRTHVDALKYPKRQYELKQQYKNAQRATNLYTRTFGANNVVTWQPNSHHVRIPHRNVHLVKRNLHKNELPSL